MKIVFIRHYPPDVSSKLRLGCYKHVLVLPAKTSLSRKGVLTLKLTHIS